MDQQRLLKHLALLMFFIFIADYIGTKLYWYYTIWYFDMPMHFLGGLWLGLFFIYVFSRKEPSFDLNFKLILTILLAVLFIGVLWELFEIYVNNDIGQIPFNLLDTISDLFCDLAGGTFAILYCYNDWYGKNS